MSRSAVLACAFACTVLLVSSPSPARAQAPTATGGLQPTRAQLEARLSEFEQSAKSPAYSDALRSQAEQEVSLLRSRLQDGDFRVGDQIAMSVEGEQALTGTFTVQEGPVIVLPEVGSLSLKGVLHSELESYLTTELGRYLKEPVVHARSLFRILIMGSVVRPGFYVVPAEALVSDLIMTAGGPGPKADLLHLSIMRGDETIWSGTAMQQAITEGRTADQLSLRAGDRVIVPEQHRSVAWQVITGSAGAVALLVSTLVTLLR